MANSSSEDVTDTLPERPIRIQPYQFEPVRQDFERIPGHRVSFDMRYSMGFAKSHPLKCWWQMGVMRRSKKVRSFELYKLVKLIHFRLTAGRLRGSSCINCYTWGLLQFAATQ